MTSQVLSRQHALFLAGGPGGRRADRFRKTLVVSLILHVCVLTFIAGFRFKRNVERPLSAVQVSLVTAPVPETKPESRVEKAKPVQKPVQPMPIPVPPKPTQALTPVPPPPPAQPKPAPTQARPSPGPSPSQSPPPPAVQPPVAPAPVATPAVPINPTVPTRPAPTLVQPGLPAPTLALPQRIQQTVTPTPTAPVRSKRNVVEDLLKDIEPPPDAPKFAEISPSKPPESKRPIQAKFERPQEQVPNELDQILKKLKVPEKMPEKMPELAPPVEPPKEQVRPIPVPPKVPSLSEELDRELKELKPVQAPPTVKLPQPVQSQPIFRQQPVQQQPAQQQPPAQSASAPKVQRAPETKLKVLSGSSSGANAYLALVQRAINEKWAAPPVDISGTALTVVIKFHLSRSGVISGVEFKQRSGNGWYDDAGRRAIMSVERLPPFPPNVTEQSYDIYFTFAVGEGAG